MTGEQILPERPAEGSAADAPEGGEKLSKKALKKLEKEKEKAEKKKALEAQEIARRAEADANDVSKGKYGEMPYVGSKDYKPLGRQRYEIYQLADVKDGEEIAVRAKVKTARSQSAKLAFLLLQRDRASIQAVIAASDTLSRQFVKFAATIPGESLVDVIGVIKEIKEPVKSATVSGRELHVTEIWIVEKAIPQLPVQPDDSEFAVPGEAAGAAGEQQSSSGRPLVGLSTRLDNRVLDLRASLNQDIFDIHDGVRFLFEEFLRKHGFKSIDSPKLLGAPSEGGANVFEVKYFDRKGYLAQSPQLYKQMAISAGRKRVYEIGPVFRAENSNTSRHLTEYTSMDMEMEFYDDYMEVLYFIRDLMLHILHGLQTQYKDQTERVRKVYPTEPFKVPTKPEDVPILDFTVGVELLAEAGIQLDENDDINSFQEKQLGEIVKEKYNTDFYILKEYPLDVRAFYTMPSSTPGKSRSYDFHLRGQEVLSGAQRIHNHALLRSEMKRRGLNPDGPGLKDYVESFQYATSPHAGGAFGLERIVANWLGLPNVRLASLFPRDPSRLSP